MVTRYDSSSYIRALRDGPLGLAFGYERHALSILSGRGVASGLVAVIGSFDFLIPAY